VGEIHKVIASLKTALETDGSARENNHATARPMPVASSAQRVELATMLGRELDAVGGQFLGILTPLETIARITSLAGEIGARSISFGAGLTLDMDAIGEALERDGRKVIKTIPVADHERLEIRERVANSDLGIAEADYAVASTGTLAVVSTETQPGSLTLLPPASAIVVHIDRLVGTLAELFAVMGPEAVAAHRMTLITGPSRTADIEKRIVLGVHGPKTLHVAVMWPRNE
jgi:L-lactate utilization protein LutC